MSAPQTSVSATLPIGVAGQLADLWTEENGDIASAISEEERSEIPFGVAVKRSSDDGAKLLAAVTDAVYGVVVFGHLYSKPDELGDVGLKPGVTIDVLRMGRVLVPIEGPVTREGGVHVRVVASGPNTIVGAFRGTADGTNTIDLSAFASWVRSASGDLGLIELNVLGT